MRLSAIALGVFVIPACVEQAPTTTGSIDQAIVGGASANIADYPSVVALEDSPGNWYCTGVLIAPEWVLTAAHCVSEPPTAALDVRFGAGEVNGGTAGTVVHSAAVYSHPGFDGNAWDNDIAIIKLATPVTTVTPTPIFRDVVALGTPVIDVGYGSADNDDNGAGELRSVEKVTSDCAAANDPSVSGDNLVCMDASDGKGSCFGDSGGPAFATIGGARMVVGVVSGGTGELCGAGLDLDTSIHAELQFIDDAMAGLVAPIGPDTDPPMPTDPDPTTPDPTTPTDPDPAPADDGGCNTTGSTSGIAMLGLAAFAIRRRRRS